MKGTKEFYEVIEQFERDFKNPECNIYVSAHNPLQRSPKDSRSVYDNGTVDQIFNAYLCGYSMCKASNNLKS